MTELSAGEQLIEDLENIRHMTGCTSNTKKKNWGFRNYYCSALEGDGYESMRRLEKLGYVKQGIGSFLSETQMYFHATEEGCKAIGLDDKQIKRVMGD
jgi:hypothetical protein